LERPFNENYFGRVSPEGIKRVTKKGQAAMMSPALFLSRECRFSADKKDFAGYYSSRNNMGTRVAILLFFVIYAILNKGHMTRLQGGEI
jgi:hypothetical protein